jgi:hypothetical protein
VTLLLPTRMPSRTGTDTAKEIGKKWPKAQGTRVTGSSNYPFWERMLLPVRDSRRPISRTGCSLRAQPQRSHKWAWWHCRADTIGGSSWGLGTCAISILLPLCLGQCLGVMGCWSLWVSDQVCWPITGSAQPGGCWELCGSQRYPMDIPCHPWCCLQVKTPQSQPLLGPWLFAGFGEVASFRCDVLVTCERFSLLFRSGEESPCYSRCLMRRPVCNVYLMAPL